MNEFKGFKLYQLGPNFKEFNFKVPRTSPGSPLLYRSPYTNANNILSKLKHPPKYSSKPIDKKHEGRYGTIVIEFYKTQEHDSHYTNSKFSQAKESKASTADPQQSGSPTSNPDRKRDLKKQEKDAEQARRAIGTTQYAENNVTKKVWINFDELIDRFEVNFSTWAHLTCERPLIKPGSYRHLSMTPPSLMQSTEFLTRVIWTVVKQ